MIVLTIVYLALTLAAFVSQIVELIGTIRRIELGNQITNNKRTYMLALVACICSQPWMYVKIYMGTCSIINIIGTFCGFIWFTLVAHRRKKLLDVKNKHE